MSDDLDDGEIPKEAVSTQSIPSMRTDRHALEADTYNTSRERQYNRIEPAIRANAARPSRYHSRSPEPPYRRGSSGSSRNYDRYSADSNAGPLRKYPAAPRKEPSVRDANTRADLGRLAREAEAAAYKARTAAANKPAISSVMPASTSGPKQTSSDTTSRSSRSPARASSTRPRSRAPENSTNTPSRLDPERRQRPLTSPRDTRSHIEDRPNIPQSTSRPSLTAADIGRLQREKEAAAYKAKVLAEAQNRSDQTPLPKASSPARVQEAQSRRSEAPVELQKRSVSTKPVPKEVVRTIPSLTPTQDAQLATLKRDYDKLTANVFQVQSEARIAYRKWTKLEHDARREEYKSDLAQKSLESISAL